VTPEGFTPKGPSPQVVEPSDTRSHALQNPGAWGGAPDQTMPSFIVTAPPSNIVSALNSSSATLVNITVDASNHCYWTNDAGSLEIRNSVAANCSIGFHGHGHSSFSYSYSLVWGVDTVATYVVDPDDLPTEGPGVLQANPMFTHVTTALHDFPYFLNCTSPAVDAGDANAGYDDLSFPPSWGGSRNDIGSYGGPSASVPLTDEERQHVTGQLLRLESSGLDTVLTWCNPPGATGSDIIRGDVATLASSAGGFSVATEECVINDHPTNSFPYSGTPIIGQGFWFLVRCEGCPAQGTYDSGAPSQVGLRDAEIAASGQDCP